MALGPEQDWIDAFAGMPVVADASWKGNLANVIDSLVTNKLSSPGLLGPTGQPAAVFTFGKAAFQGALGTPDPAGLASALAAGLAASTAVVAPGSYIGTDTPATKFSVVASSLIDPASQSAAAAKIASDVGGKPAVDDPNDSQVPGVFRAAFLLLKLTTSGTNSVAPTPAPLTDPLRAMG